MGNLYLGPDHDHSPPNPFWTNPAIVMASTVFHAGDKPTLQVVTRNHGDAPAPNTEVELFWADPSTGFLALPERRIGLSSGLVDPRSGTSGIDGSLTLNFGWGTAPGEDGVPPEAASTNGGHVCLLARAKCTALDEHYDEAHPTSDPLTAIHNVHVHAAGLMGSAAGNAGAGGKGERERFFAFAATNIFGEAVGTRLEAVPLDPTKDREKLEHLLAIPTVHEIASRRGKFRAPAEVQLTLGKETVVPPERLLKSRRSPEAALGKAAASYRLGHTGVLGSALAKALTAAPATCNEITLDLLPFEIRQGLLSVVPGGEDGDISVVEIHHVTTEKQPRLIGGLTVVYQTARNMF